MMTDARAHNALVTFIEQWFEANYDWPSDDNAPGITDAEGQRISVECYISAKLHFPDLDAPAFADAYRDYLQRERADFEYNEATADVASIWEEVVAIAIHMAKEQEDGPADRPRAALHAFHVLGWNDEDDELHIPGNVMMKAMKRAKRKIKP